jgi:hypothetical protein
VGIVPGGKVNPDCVVGGGGRGVEGPTVAVTVTLAVLPLPAALLPMTEYVVVTVGETVPPEAVAAKPVLVQA